MSFKVEINSTTSFAEVSTLAVPAKTTDSFRFVSNSTPGLFKYNTNSILDCVALGKYPVELWSTKYKKFFYPSVYQENNLVLKCDNITKLKMLIINLLKKKKYPIIESSRKKFFLNSSQTKNVIQKITEFIEF